MFTWILLVGGGLLLFLTIAGGAFVLYLHAAEARKEKEVRAKGRPVLAALVMANETLQDPKGDPETAGVVVFTFEPPTPPLAAHLREVAEKVYALYRTRKLGKLGRPERKVAELIQNHNYRDGRRNLLPPEIAGSYKVYLADLWVVRDRLPDGWNEARALACKAAGGDEGQIILLKSDEAEARSIYEAVR